MNNKKIGFIGQGWVGKNYANDFEKRGYNVVRYALEKPYIDNKEKIKDCDIVFIAVPTPSINDKFDDSILRDAISLVGHGKTAVIKSTLLPGRTELIQKDYPNIFVMHSPEFLREVTAAYDAAHPDRNIIGLPQMSDQYKIKAKEVLSVLPLASFEQICSAREAELIKYGGNVFLYFKVIFANMLHDLAENNGARYEEVKNGLKHDPRIGESHLDPIHKSGRGAGGHCFIKDFSAFSEIYQRTVGDEAGMALLEAFKNKNIAYLLSSKKDLDILSEVYGETVTKNNK